MEIFDITDKEFMIALQMLPELPYEKFISKESYVMTAV
jgi:hypothetical protein